jgi:hypothetical protein
MWQCFQRCQPKSGASSGRKSMVFGLFDENIFYGVFLEFFRPKKKRLQMPLWKINYKIGLSCSRLEKSLIQDEGSLHEHGSGGDVQSKLVGNKARTHHCPDSGKERR